MFPGTHATSAPDRPAVIMAESGRTLTYKELDDNSARLASALHAMGLRQGDVIAMLSDNAAEAFEIYWAALRSGLYITAVNWHLAAEEAAYILQDSGARVVIASFGVRELAERLLDLVPEVQRWYCFGGAITGYLPYGELLAAVGPRLTDQPRVVLLGHHWTAQGHQASPAADPGRPTRGPACRAVGACFQDLPR